MCVRNTLASLISKTILAGERFTCSLICVLSYGDIRRGKSASASPSPPATDRICKVVLLTDQFRNLLLLDTVLAEGCDRRQLPLAANYDKVPQRDHGAVPNMTQLFRII